MRCLNLTTQLSVPVMRYQDLVKIDRVPRNGSGHVVGSRG